MALIKFLASTVGRWVRGLVGAAVIAYGIFGHHHMKTLIATIVIGGVLVAAGLFDFCLLAPLFKMPFSGKKIREQGK